MGTKSVSSYLFYLRNKNLALRRTCCHCHRCAIPLCNYRPRHPLTNLLLCDRTPIQPLSQHRIQQHLLHDCHGRWLLLCLRNNDGRKSTRSIYYNIVVWFTHQILRFSCLSSTVPNSSTVRVCSITVPWSLLPWSSTSSVVPWAPSFPSTPSSSFATFF